MATLPRTAFAALALLIASAAYGATITGTVTAGDTHRPIQNMVVQAYDAAGSLRASSTTDATGFYALSLSAGLYRVLAFDNFGQYATAFDGGADSYESSPFINLTTTATINFVLPLAGTISGTVYEPGGMPRGNAVVAAYNLSGTRRGSTITNFQGQYSLVVPPGEYKVVAFDDTGTYAAAFFRDAKDFAAAIPVTVTATRVTAGIDFRLTVAARIIGTVVDSATQAPLPGMRVYAYTEQGVLVQEAGTDASGVFRMSLPAGNYRFVAADLSHVYATTFYPNARSFTAAQTFTLVAGQLYSSLVVGVPRGGVLTGRVTTAAGAPLPNITVAAYNPDGTQQSVTTTGSDGSYELVAAPGSVLLAAFDPAFAYSTQVLPDAIPVVAGQRVGGYHFTLQLGGRVSGLVRDATGQPLARITVAAYTTEGNLVGRTSTDASGRFNLVLPPGEVRLIAFDDSGRFLPRYDNGAATFDTTTPRSIVTGTHISADFTLTLPGPRRRAARH